MNQKKDTLILLISLMLTLGILGLGAWWLWGRNGQFGFNGGGSNEKGTPTGEIDPHQPVDSLISGGDRLLVGTKVSREKTQAVAALMTGDYDTAVINLEAALSQNPNDPEGLIYLNNARIGAKKAYAIAVAVPIGNDLDGSQEILRGIAQAQEEINNQQGGINNIPLKVFIANDNNDSVLAQKLAKAFAKQPEILGVVGHWASDVSLATGEIYEAEKLVAISPISTSVKISSLGDYIFRTVPSDRFAGSALSRYQVQTLRKKATGIFYNSQSNYSRSLKDEFTTALFGDGGNVVGEYDLGDPNFNAANAINEAIAGGAEVLMLATNTGTLDQTLQVIQVNDGKLNLLAGDDAYAPKILQIGGRDAIGLVVAIPWHVLAHQDELFTQTSRQLWGGDVSWRTAMAYDAAKSLIMAISMNPNPDRATVQASLANPGFRAQGASGDVRFLPSGDRHQAVQLVEVQPGTRSGFGFDFVPVP
ncbi:MAG: ABC transporter substrate-binding protein [Synechococcaceae cyanobacterium RL_1_2]|nr:ABC transporter substrate-binding protein [Synechococcaceae cyanobacterium RL_1_2]